MFPLIQVPDLGTSDVRECHVWRSFLVCKHAICCFVLATIYKGALRNSRKALTKIKHSTGVSLYIHETALFTHIGIHVL